MKPRSGLSVLAVAIGALTGCSAIDVAPTAMQPVQSLVVQTQSASEFYARGRREQDAGNVSLAIVSFRRTLTLDANHVEATNALAVAYAQTGRDEESLALFRRAIELAPNAAHVHNNYGYALFRVGRLDEAERALLVAVQQDPDHRRTLDNLALTRNALAARAPATVAGAPSPTAMNTETATTEAPNMVVTEPTMVAVQVAPQVYELSDRPITAAAASPAAASSPVAAADTVQLVSDGSKDVLALRFEPRQLGLEISNGVGINGLARRTARQLQQAGLAAIRLTNATNFREAKTQILFRDGYESVASALGKALPVSVGLAPTVTLRKGINLRLVLGHDTAGRILAGLESLVPIAEAAEPATVDGWRWS